MNRRVTDRNDSQIARRIPFHDKLVGRILCAELTDLNMLCDPFFRDERAVGSVEQVVDVC
jgi:hypothetical protein